MWRSVAFTALLVCLSCGDDDDDRTAAIMKCQALGDSACARRVDCVAPGSPDRAKLIADCKTGVMSTLDCGKAVAVGESYDRCISELASATCVAFTANPPLLPASCRQVIKLAD